MQKIALCYIEELIESLLKTSEALLPLRDLEQSMISIESENDGGEVRRLAAMSKFQRIIDPLGDANSSIKKAVDAVE